MLKLKNIHTYILSLSVVLCIAPMNRCAAAADEISDAHYVSSSTGDDKNPGTKQNPWRSLDKIRLPPESNVPKIDRIAVGSIA